jgi:aryl-alcohol dehydrogenase-like predicted oxidoreductase
MGSAVQYVRLGESGIEVSRIALGTWAMGDGAYWGPQDDRDSIRTIHAALERGVTHIDTAEGYGDGRSEAIVGRGIRDRRAEAVVATKAFGKSLVPANLPLALEASLRGLGTDYVDLYYIHWPNPEVPLAETMGALGRLVEAGKVRGVAICNFGPRNLQALAEVPTASARPLVHQLPYNLLWRAIEGPIVEASDAASMPIVAYSGLAQGLLTGAYRSIGAVPDHMKVTRFYRGDNGIAKHGEAGVEAEVFAAIAALDALCGEAGLSMPELALAWLLQKGNVASVLVGARTPEELGKSVAAADLAVPADVLERATAATKAVRERLGDNADMWMGGAESRFV